MVARSQFDSPPQYREFPDDCKASSADSCACYRLTVVTGFRISATRDRRLRVRANASRLGQIQVINDLLGCIEFPIKCLGFHRSPLPRRASAARQEWVMNAEIEVLDGRNALPRCDSQLEAIHVQNWPPSTSRSTKCHSRVSRNRRTSSSNASACSGAYSNQVRKSNASPSSRQWCRRLAMGGR